MTLNDLEHSECIAYAIIAGGVSGATWSHATVPESGGSCRRPAQTSPTSVSVVKPTVRATIPANNCRSTDISSRCITPLELIAIRFPAMPLPGYF